MARPYVSQLRFMYDTWLKDHRSIDTFNDLYMENFGNIWDDHHRHDTLHTFATVQYEAEKLTWDLIWPHTSFPGINPGILYDGATWDLISEEGLKFNRKKFQRSWVDCLLKAQEAFPSERTEIQQYEAEKLWWDLRWPNKNFPGIDPRPFLDPKNTQFAAWDDIQRQRKADGKAKSKSSQSKSASRDPKVAEEFRAGPSTSFRTKREIDDDQDTQFMIEICEKLAVMDREDD